MISWMTPQGTVYDSFGAGQDVVVLVHGLGLNRHSWKWQVPSLARSHRVITYDLYGHGDSRDPPRTPSLALFSDQLAGLLDHLGISRASVFGFSLGGMIVRRFAVDHRQKLLALGILHSAHARDKAAQDAVEARMLQAAQDGPAATVEAALQRWFTDRFRATHPEMMEEVRRWILSNRKEVYASIYQVLAHGVAEVVKPRPPIAAPTLVMTGEDDHGNSPAMSMAIATEIPGAELVVLPGLRHMAMAEAPELFNTRLQQFLARVRDA